MNFRKYSAIAFCFLISCSSGKKITGHRELFLSDNTDIKISEAIVNKKVVSEKKENKNWIQKNFSETNEAVNLNFDIKNAKYLWKSKIGEGDDRKRKIICNIVSKDGFIFGSDSYGNIFAFDISKKKNIWKVNIAKGIEDIAKVGGIGILDDSDLVVTTAKGQVFLIDKKDGKIKKTKNLRSPLRAAPCISKDHILIQSSNNNLFLLNKNLKAIWKQFETQEEVIFLGGSSPATNGKVTIAAYSTGEFKLYDVFSGNELWSDFMVPCLHNETVSTMLHIYASPVISGNEAIIFGHGGNLICCNILSGKQIWDLNTSGVNTPAVINDWIFVLNSDSKLLCVEKKTGSVKWKAEIPADKKNNIRTSTSDPLVVGDSVLLIANDGTLIFFDFNSGKVMHSVESKITNSVSTIIVDKKIYILSSDGYIYAFG